MRATSKAWHAWHEWGDVMARAVKRDNQGADARYERFARCYVIHHDGTRAATETGYSAKTAAAQASRLLKNAKVQALLARFEAECHQRLEITKDKIERELARIGFMDPRKFFREDGTLLDPKEWGDDEAAALSSIEVLEEFAGRGEDRKLIGLTKKIKFWDKKGALETLGAAFSIGVKKIEQGPPGAFNEQKDDIKARIKDRSVRLGVAKVFDIREGKRKAAAK